jgi:4-amino-4-deoxy-L-arabinose transferase-like glycosyltransferase
MKLLTIQRNSLLTLILLLALAWFGTLDYRRLINPDEGRYAEIPREMVASGDWLTPRMNDLKYFEKPALQYWATAAAYTAFGEHNWTARLWPALTGFAGILFTGFAAARLLGARAGPYAGAVLAGSVLWTVIGHANTLDMGVSFFLAAAVFALCLGEHPNTPATNSRLWTDGAWALLALAVLSKGLIGLVLPAATVVLYTLWQRDWDFLRRIRLLRGILILLVITAPWFIAVSLANPEFAHFFFIHEHVQRFLTKSHGRYQPMWYFIPILLIGMIPWLGCLIQGALRGVRKEQGGGFQPARFLLVWIIVVFGFFSVSSSKLASYILPLFPALAALIGLYLSEMRDRPALRWQALPAIVLGLAALVLAWQAPRFANNEVPATLYAGYQPWLYAAALALLAAGLVAFRFGARGQGLPLVLTLATGAHLFGQCFLLGHDHVGRVNSAYDAVQAIRDQVRPDVPFYSVNTFDHSLHYYLKRSTTMVSYRDELGFGVAQEPHKFIPDMAGFEAAWRAAPMAWAMMSPATWQELNAKKLPMREVFRDTRRVIVKKP